VKRNPNSTRSVKWIERNSLNNPSCERYVKSLIDNHFEFKTYKINEYDTTEKALWVTYGCFSYIIEIDKDNISLKVLEQNIGTSKNKYHLLKKNFSGDSCWYDCLSWIKDRQIF
jgi:hypothetical protein